MTLARIGNAPADEWKAIAREAAKLRKESPTAIEPLILAADQLAAQGDIAAAIKLLRAEIALRPGDPRLWSALAAIVGQRTGNHCRRRGCRRGPTRRWRFDRPAIGAARIWADDFLPGRSQRLARLEQLSPTASDADRARLLNGLAEIYSEIHDDVGRFRILTATASHDRQNLDTRKTLYTLALRGDNDANRAHWRDEIRRIEGPDGRSVAVLDALHQAMNANTKDSRRRMAGPWQNRCRRLSGQYRRPTLIGSHSRAAGRWQIRYRTSGCRGANRAIVDPLSGSSTRLSVRTGRDEIARNCLVRLESDPRLTPLKFRGIVKGAIRQAGRGVNRSACLGSPTRSKPIRARRCGPGDFWKIVRSFRTRSPCIGKPIRRIRNSPMPGRHG